jgi:hypothetical protein
MSQRFCLLVIFLSNLLSFACKQSNLDSFDLKYDLVREIAARIHEETQIIDFKKVANPEEYFLQGWSFPEENHTWAQGKNCSLAFYRYDTKNDLELEAVCRTIPSGDRRKQIISVFLNGNSVGSFIPDPTSFQSFRLTLPSSFFIVGRNIIEFSSSCTSKPSEILSRSTDSKDLSVAFQRIEFKQHLNHFVDMGLVQKANSNFIAFATLPAQFEFFTRYKNLHDATSSIVLISELNEKIPIALSPRKGSYKKTIHLKKEGIYELRFSTKGRQDSYTIWSQIEVRIPKRSTNNLSKVENVPHSKKPDILFYVVDALRADHLSCYGYERRTSPNIDKFGQENSLYLNAYSNASWTKPSGASILTGLYPKHHKTMKRDEKLPDNVVTLAEKLQEIGYYTTAFVGNGNLSHVFGFDQGFNLYKEFFETYPYSRHVQSDTINKKVFEFFKEFLSQNERKPLFMLIWTVDPHDPYTPEESVKRLFDIHRYTPIDTYDFRLLEKIRDGYIRPSESQIEFMKIRYDQEIYFNDKSFGELLNVMKDYGIYDNSVIIFTSDHGEEFFEHGGVGHGLTLYNDEIKIPLLIRMPDIEKKIHKERVQHFDIYPTILEMLKLKTSYELDGTSFLGNTDPNRTLYFEEELDLNDLNAILDRDKKLIYNRRFYRPPSSKSVQVLELFTQNDTFEINCLPFGGYSDQMRLQELFSFRNSRDEFGIKRQGVNIPAELDEKLKALGYIR